MKRLRYIFISFLLPVLSFSQDKDSSVLDQTTAMIRQMDSTHRADSLRRLSLLTEIENLKGRRANKERENLLLQLKQIEAQDSLKKIRQLQKLEAMKGTAVGFPVAPFKDTLFSVFTKIGSFGAKERATAIGHKIRILYDDFQFQPDSLAVVASENTVDIAYRDLVIMSINEMDALWFSQTQYVIAKRYRDSIANAIDKEREANSVLSIGLRIGAILLIILGIYIVVRLINRLFKRLRKKVVGLKERFFSGIKLGNYQFLDSKRQMQVVSFSLNALRILVILLALYIALPLLFSVFPWTRGIAETLISWIVSPLKKTIWAFIAYLPNLFTILVIVFVTRYVSRFLKYIATEIENGALVISGFYPDWANPTFNIVKFLLYAFAFIIIFPYLPGSDSPIFQGVSVFLGIIFSLGSSSAISNAVAGLVITYMRPFRIGDRIKIGEVTGDVVEKSLLVTRIRTIKNEDITIPNASVLSGHTTNYTTSAKELGLILHTDVTIGYDVPWKQVHELLVKAALETKGVMSSENKKPFVLQTSLDDFYVSYQLNAYTEESQRMAAIYSELHQQIQDKFNEAGVEILSPHYRAARDGNMTTIPSNYLPADYQPPAFNISTLDKAKPKE